MKNLSLIGLGLSLGSYFLLVTCSTTIRPVESARVVESAPKQRVVTVERHVY